MAKLSLHIDDKVDTQFRNAVAMNLGMKKGNLTMAIEEAMTYWILQKSRRMKKETKPRRRIIQKVVAKNEKKLVRVTKKAWPEEERALGDIRSGKTEMVFQSPDELLAELKGLENEP